MKQKAHLTSTITGVIAALMVLFVFWKALEEFITVDQEIGHWLEFSPWKFILGLLTLVFLWGSINLVIAIIVRRWDKLDRLECVLAVWRDRLGWLRWPLVGILLLLPVWLLQYTSWGAIFTGLYIRLMLLLGTGVAIGVLLTQGEKILVRASSIAAGLLIAVSALILSVTFWNITDYPFSLTWSEGNRMWDYSVLFGRRLYNYPNDQFIFVFLDLGRQALWGFPFLFADITIKQMRLWSGLLASLPYALLGWVAFKRYGKVDILWILSGLWAFVFLSQGPIYTPLILSAILVAIAWRRPLWISLPLIAISGYYAQVSRYTWIFAPAMWAGLLYVGDSTCKRIGIKNWRFALSGVLAGCLGGYIIPHLLVFVQTWQRPIKDPGSPGQPSAVTNIVNRTQLDLFDYDRLQFIVSRQPLLWERLLPNPTYGPGILLALALVTVPLIIFLIYLIRTQRWDINWFQGGVILVTLSLFLGVGLVVSVKIGGGSNLHNVDMFLIGLVFVAALAWAGGGYRVLSHLEGEPLWVQMALILMIVAFAYEPLRRVTPLSLPPTEIINEAMSTIQKEVSQAKEAGEILFMDQRQLLTFGNVQDVPLVTDYEKKYLMDKAMSGKETLFEEFYRDLANSRFSMIISEPLKTRYQTDLGKFGEENNVWVEWVSEPVLCYYKPIATFPEVRVQLLVPRKKTLNCP